MPVKSLPLRRLYFEVDKVHERWYLIAQPDNTVLLDIDTYTWPIQDGWFGWVASVVRDRVLANLQMDSRVNPST